MNFTSVNGAVLERKLTLFEPIFMVHVLSSKQRNIFIYRQFRVPFGPSR